MLDQADVLRARDCVAETARHTPLEYSYTFSDMTGADVHLKLETFQRTGSFKIRGATNRIATLSEAEQEAGVVTASAGNHAQGVALAATRIGVDSTIVMPEHAPVAKVKATRSYEVLEDLPGVETVVVAVGGGGLISGIATALKASDPDIRVVGVQAEGASSVAESLEQGTVVERDSVETIADGIATRKVGEQTFEVIRERVDEVVTVSDDETAVALATLLERGKTLVEGAGAVALAALIEGRFDYAEGETVVPCLCGGNIDLNVLTTVVMRGLIQTGRYLRLRTTLKDRPGELERLVAVISDHRANIYAIEHDRAARDVALNDAEVELDLETRGPDHVDELLDALHEAGYDVEVLV